MYSICIGDTVQYIYIYMRTIYQVSIYIIYIYIYTYIMYIHRSAWENKLGALALVFNVYFIGLQLS